MTDDPKHHADDSATRERQEPPTMNDLIRAARNKPRRYKFTTPTENEKDSEDA